MRAQKDKIRDATKGLEDLSGDASLACFIALHVLWWLVLQGAWHTAHVPVHLRRLSLLAHQPKPFGA